VSAGGHECWCHGKQPCDCPCHEPKKWADRLKAAADAIE